MLHRHHAAAGSGVRHLVEKPDGRFVMKLTLDGNAPAITFTMSTPDAHDFGSRVAAEAWIRANGIGKVAVMTAEGYWPLED